MNDCVGYNLSYSNHRVLINLNRLRLPRSGSLANSNSISYKSQSLDNLRWDCPVKSLHFANCRTIEPVISCALDHRSWENGRSVLSKEQGPSAC